MMKEWLTIDPFLGVGFNVELGESRRHLGICRKYLYQINVCPWEI